MLQQKPYVPLLKTGIAEIGAYKALYPDIKDLIFPIFALRPWPNANKLQLSVDRVLEATGGYPFGLGLDAERLNHQSGKQAQVDFNALFDEGRGFETYYELIADTAGAVPVLIPTRSVEVLLRQIANADALNRGLIVHQRRGAVVPISGFLSSLPPLPNDTIIVVDAGWSRDYLQLESWALPLVERVASALPDAEVVVMSSSFPDSFTEIVGHATAEGMERRLYNAAVQRFQQQEIVYGDWGSTRPPQGGGGGDIPSRVDVPTVSGWEIFRANPDNDLGFAEMAWDAQHHESFGPLPNCWGKEMISASDDEGHGISSRQLATQSRINAHLTVQSGGASILPADEVPYID